MLRSAIIVKKDLHRGQAANVAAILMGQAAAGMKELYASEPPSDATGHSHAAIMYNVVVLGGTEGKLLRLSAAASEAPEVRYFVFTLTGQSLSNSYDEYVTYVRDNALEPLRIAGIVVSGPDNKVRELTRGFSLLK